VFNGVRQSSVVPLTSDPSPAGGEGGRVDEKPVVVLFEGEASWRRFLSGIGG
jgi:hypothetical protein